MMEVGWTLDFLIAANRDFNLALRTIYGGTGSAILRKRRGNKFGRNFFPHKTCRLRRAVTAVL